MAADSGIAWLMGDQLQQQPLLVKAQDLVLRPFRTATSKAAQRAYLGTVFVFAASLILFALSTVAYALFYYNYVPRIGVTSAVHLQFGNGHPHGTVHLPSGLISQQAYDISLALHLPRTPANLATGNFMVDLTLYGPSKPGTSPLERVHSAFGSADDYSQTVLGRSRRPAILTYASPIVRTAHVLVNLPAMLIGWRKESEKLEISLFEAVEFPKGWKNIPGRMKVVIEADEKMQVYDAEIRVRARFRGLRWMMYNHRIISFAFFTSTFFMFSTTASILAYFTFAAYEANSEVDVHMNRQKVKNEGSDSEQEPIQPLSTSDLSDTARSFPALGRQRPLEFQRRPSVETRVKEEEIERTTGIDPLVGEADDEDDFEDEGSSAWRDSGIGTGRDDRGRQPTQRRRRVSQDR